MITFGAYSNRFVQDEPTDRTSSAVKKSMEAKEGKRKEEIRPGADEKGATVGEKEFRSDSRTVFQAELCVADEEQVWSGTTEINLFDGCYINEKKQESVRSEEKQNVIAPGTQKQYRFHVINRGTQSVRYQIWYETQEQTSGFCLPVELELKRMNLTENKTEEIERKNRTEFLLQSGTSDVYVVQWNWLYEREDDPYDTLLGDLAVDQELKYIVKIHIRAELDTKESSQDKWRQKRKAQSSQEQSEERMRTGIKTGDMAKWSYWCMMCVISLMFGILLYGGLKWIGYSAATVMSGSMEPKLKVGDMVILEPVNRRDSLKRGDIIVYRSGKKRIVHRLVSVSKNTLRVKGDANNREDQPIQFRQVEGKVICRIPKVGKLFSGNRTSGKTSTGEKGIYGAYSYCSGQEEQASVAGFDLRAEGEKVADLTLDPRETDGASYTFSVTSHSQVNVKYQIVLEFEEGSKLPDGVNYRITPEQGRIEAGDDTPAEHRILFWFDPSESSCGEAATEDPDNQDKKAETEEIQVERKADTEEETEEIKNRITEQIKIRIVAEQTE